MARRNVVLVVALLVAALGTGLVFLYANSADQRALAGQETVEVLVAKADIPAGTSGAAAEQKGLLEAKEIASSAAATDALSPADLPSISGLVAVSTIFEGEQIVAAKFGTTATAGSIPLPEGTIAVSIDLPFSSQAAGFVTPGAEVAVFNTADRETGLIVPEATVVGVGTTSNTAAEGNGAEGVSRTVLTLAVDQADAQRLIYASHKGTLDVALVNNQSSVGPAPLTNENNLWA